MTNTTNNRSIQIQVMVRGFCLAGIVACGVLVAPNMAQAQSIKAPLLTNEKPVVVQQVTAPIKFGKLETYTHPTQWFTMQIPSNWSQEDLTTDERAIISISDPTGNAGLVAAVYGGESEMSKDEMGGKLDEYIQTAFGDFPQFKADAPKALKSFNGAGLGFSYSQKLKNNKTITMYGDAFYQQYDKAVTGIFVLLLPKEQYESAKAKMYDLLDGIEVQPEHYEAAPTNDETGANVVVGDLTDYSDDSGTYFLRVPTDWTQSTGTGNGLDYISWADESGLGTLSVVATEFKASPNTTALKKSAQEFINGYAQGNDAVNDLELTGSTTLDKNAVIARFNYTSESESGSVPMSAQVLVRQSGKTGVFVLLAMPSTSTDANADAMNEILQSVEIWK